MDHEELLVRATSVLNQIVGHSNPNRWGYDAAHVAMNDEWREEARAVLRDLERQMITNGEDFRNVKGPLE